MPRLVLDEPTSIEDKKLTLVLDEPFSTSPTDENGTGPHLVLDEPSSKLGKVASSIMDVQKAINPINLMRKVDEVLGEGYTDEEFSRMSPLNKVLDVVTGRGSNVIKSVISQIMDENDAAVA